MVNISVAKTIISAILRIEIKDFCSNRFLSLVCGRTSCPFMRNWETPINRISWCEILEYCFNSREISRLLKAKNQVNSFKRFLCLFFFSYELHLNVRPSRSVNAIHVIGVDQFLVLFQRRRIFHQGYHSIVVLCYLFWNCHGKRPVSDEIVHELVYGSFISSLRY